MESFDLKGKMLIIKEHSIYEFGFADQYGPQRLNPHLPNNIQKLVVSQGTESEIVCRTFLTAQRLFKSERLLEGIDSERALSITFEVLHEFIALETEINDYLKEETAASSAYNQRKETKASYAIPSVPDVATRCKTIFQKTDHIIHALMEVVTIFYPTWKLNIAIGFRLEQVAFFNKGVINKKFQNLHFPHLALRTCPHLSLFNTFSRSF
jgi:hypothetical protein